MAYQDLSAILTAVPGAPGASWGVLGGSSATAASSSPSGRVGFLPLPGGINQTRATPRGVEH